MPTYQVTCHICGQEKWPTLPSRPDTYVCVLCTAAGPARATKRREHRHRTSPGTESLAQGRERTGQPPPRPQRRAHFSLAVPFQECLG